MAVTTTIAIDALLVIMVLAVWLGCVGFARLRTSLDRMHCAAFVNTTAGTALVLVAFLSDGLSVRAGKILLVAATSLLGGAAMSHAVGRTILLRGCEPQAITKDAEAQAEE
jgi:multisubunit Na+/H+ antiporter MnhG subunit